MRKPKRIVTAAVALALAAVFSVSAMFLAPRYVPPLLGWALLDKHERAFVKAVRRAFPVHKESVDYRSARIIDGSVLVYISKTSAHSAGLVSGDTTGSLTWNNERLPIHVRWLDIPSPQQKTVHGSFRLPDSQHIVSVQIETDPGVYVRNGPEFYENAMKRVITDLLDSLGQPHPRDGERRVDAGGV